MRRSARLCGKYRVVALEGVTALALHRRLLLENPHLTSLLLSSFNKVNQNALMAPAGRIIFEETVLPGGEFLKKFVDIILLPRKIMITNKCQTQIRRLSQVREIAGLIRELSSWTSL
jgi:hypothetical protein